MTAADDELGAVAALVLVDALDEARHALHDLEEVADLAAGHLAAHGEGAAGLTAAAVVQDLRRKLGQVEASILRETGPLLRKGELDKVGQLPDGRPYELLRGADRKAWRHEDWQRDARQALVDSVVSGPGQPDLISRETGQIGGLAAILHVIVHEVQHVHGSTAPRTRELRRLGLDPDDYAETVPGSWSLRVTS